MPIKKFALLLFSLALITGTAFSQKSSAPSPALKQKKKTDHHPSTAMIFSACVPGLGQAYNKKYWKIPVIYAAMGTTIYFVDFNNKLYRSYKRAYIARTDTSAATIDNYPLYNATQLKELQDYHHRYRDLSAIFTFLFYTINVVDAYVDGHLRSFDVSDNLSLHIHPSFNFYSANRKPVTGLALSLKF